MRCSGGFICGEGGRGGMVVHHTQVSSTRTDKRQKTRHHENKRLPGKENALGKAWGKKSGTVETKGSGGEAVASQRGGEEGGGTRKGVKGDKGG